MQTKGTVKLLIFILISGLIYSSLFSCKPIKETVIEYRDVFVHDTIKGKDGRDSIVERIVKVEVEKTNTITRWKERFDNKRFKDSLNYVRGVYNDSLRNAYKTNKVKYKYITKYKTKVVKQEGRTDRWRIVALISIIALLVVIIIKRF